MTIVVEGSVIEGSEEVVTSWGPPDGFRRPPPRRIAKVCKAPVAFLAAGLVAGIAFDAAVRQSRPALGFALWCVAVAIGLMWAAESRRPALIAWAAALSFVPWFALRSSPWLLGPDFVAFAALIGYGADLAAGGPVRRRVTGLCRVVLSSIGALFEAPSVIGRASSGVLDRFTGNRRGSWRHVGRALAIAVPVVAVLFVLLVSGDALFAATFNFDTGDGFGHIALTAVGLFVFAVPLTMSTGPSHATSVKRHARLRSLDAVMLLGGVSALFVLYAAVQLSGLLSGAKYVEEQTGLTYAEYARSGFFQLMAAAAISFVVLCAVRPTVHEAIRRRTLLRWLIAVVVVLTQVLVVGSIVRLRLYSDVFGLTHLRLYTVVSAVWLGSVVVLAGVAAIRRGHGDWMAVTASALAALAVLAMNFVNPDRLVAQENIGRVDVSEARFDGSYLASLSSDAIPWIIDHIEEVPAEQRDELEAALCENTYKGDGWLAYNAADAAAERALADFCV